MSSTSSVIAPALKQLEASGAATTGVKSFAALSSWFSNAVAPRVHSASLTPSPEDATVVSHLASIALSKIMFRPTAGAVEGSDVGAVLARAEWCLGEKDLDGAAREVNGLKGWPGKLAADWLREARRKLEVQQALEVGCPFSPHAARQGDTTDMSCPGGYDGSYLGIFALELDDAYMIEAASTYLDLFLVG